MVPRLGDVDQPLLTPAEQGGGPGRAEWERAAAAVLRKAGRMAPEDPDDQVWRVLTRTTLDGIDVPPLGVPEDLRGLPDTGAPGAAPYTRGARSTPEDGWDVRAHLAEPDPRRAAADALLDLENGVTSLWLSLGRGGLPVAALPEVLAEVHVDLAPVALDCPGDLLGAAEAFTDLLSTRRLTAATATVLAVDPVGARLRGHPGPAAAAVVPRLLDLADRSGALACTVDATAVHDLGAGDAQELGYSLAVGVELLRAATATGATVHEAAGLLEFRYAATDEQLPTTAKLRAARRLWHRVLELSGAPDAPGQRQHAVTSRPMLTRYDPWVNMVRGTIAAFAAGTGGATAVTVLPFDTALGLPDALARRNARNTSALLVHEAHVARVTDPAGGAWLVERLTEDLAQAGWAEFQQVEAEGGASASLAVDGGLLRRVRDLAASRRRQVATRQRLVTGVSAHPDLDERLPARRAVPDGAPSTDRHGRDFEVLRDDPRATPVFLATLGPLAAHTARAGEAADVLAAGGVRTVAAGATATPDDVVAAYRAAGGPGTCPVVCLAGTDEAYAEQGAVVVAALRAAGATRVVLAGVPGERTVPGDLVDDSATDGSDVVAFLTRLRQELPR